MYVSAILPIVCLCVLVFALNPQKAYDVSTYTQMCDNSSLEDLGMHLPLAFGFSLQHLALFIGVSTCLATYNPAQFKLHKILPIAVLMDLLMTFMMLLFNAIYDIQGQGSSLDDVIFDVVMDKMDTPGRAVAFLLFIVLAKLNAIAILKEAVVSSLTDYLASSKWNLLSGVTCCFGLFLLGLLFIVPNGSEILANTQFATQTAAIILLPMIVS